MAGGGLPSLTGVLLDAQLTSLGLVRRPSKRQGQGGFRAAFVGSSISPSYASAVLKLGAPYLVGASFTRTPVQSAVLTVTGGPVNLAGASFTKTLSSPSTLTTGTGGGGAAGSLSWSAAPNAVGYIVYWDTVSGPPYSNSADVGNVTSVMPASVGMTGTGLRYVNVRSYDSAGPSVPGPWGVEITITL